MGVDSRAAKHLDVSLFFARGAVFMFTSERNAGCFTTPPTLTGNLVSLCIEMLMPILRRLPSASGGLAEEGVRGRPKPAGTIRFQSLGLSQTNCFDAC